MVGDKAKLLLILKKMGSVPGRTRFQKLVFLLQHKENTGFHYNFIPYHYGPYSQELQLDLSVLEAGGYIHVRHQYDNLYVHSLTKKGEEASSQILLHVEDDDVREFIPKIGKYRDTSTPDLISEAKRLAGML